jgi:hypothetical protein
VPVICTASSTRRTGRSKPNNDPRGQTTRRGCRLETRTSASTVAPSGRWMPNLKGTGKGLFLFRAEMTAILVSQNARCANCYQKRINNLRRSKVELPPGSI